MSFEIIPGGGDILLLCDHASNAVPAGIDLGIAPELLALHIAYDVGAGDLTRALAARLEAPAVLGTVSRLVADLNRAPADPGLAPSLSDGHAIPGNISIDLADRVARFHLPYHDAVAGQIARHDPRLIVAIHSFTPRLAGDDQDRPWHAGILYGPQQAEAGELAIAALRREGLTVGDNLPYPGDLYNATLDRHATAGIAAINVEVRNDLIGDDAGVARWGDILARMIADVRNGLAPQGPTAT